jgi:diguanylate cyclase (GGDEF)-like protein|tara:strand:+ start:15342 stop:17084 length:1743 start_codon:yes stop_codon:yes gene_type:complete
MAGALIRGGLAQLDAPAPEAGLTLADRDVADALPFGLLLFRTGSGGTPVCSEVNVTFTRWANRSAQSLTGVPIPEVPLLNECRILLRYIASCLAGGAVPTGELAWTVKPEDETTGRDRYFSAKLAVRSGYVLVSVRDRSSEIKAESHLRMTMLSDDLTGLPNRLQFSELVETALTEREDREVAVLLLNIDRFKRINDSLGHTVGDEFLIALARRLSSCIRGSDRLARLGGDEFAMLLTGLTDEMDTRDIIARVQRRLVDPFQLSGGEVHASATIGIATTISSTTKMEDLMRDAHFALTQARNAGASGVELYKAQDHSKARARFAMETDLRRALDAGELSLAFQPLVSLRDGMICGVEALSRWRCPKRGLVPPDEFIPIAEESGLIVPLGRWALQEACTQMAKIRGDLLEAQNIHLAVNVSGVQLLRDDIVEAVSTALATSGLPGTALKIELTESAIVGNPERARHVFARLKALGCMIAMDDFGTGYSSLSYLQTLPIDILKIDRSFVDGMLESADSQNIVRAILSLSRALNMTTVAEGIETEGQKQALALAGCEVGQGFLFARPLDADGLVARLREKKGR